MCVNHTDIRIERKFNIRYIHTSVKLHLKNNVNKQNPWDLKNNFLRVHRTLSFAPETQTFTLVNSEYFTFHLFLPYCGWQWCVQLNYNSRVLTSYDNVSYSKNTTRAYATHINSSSPTGPRGGLFGILINIFKNLCKFLS